MNYARGQRNYSGGSGSSGGSNSSSGGSSSGNSGSSSNGSGGRRNYPMYYYDMGYPEEMIRDQREGRSPIMRRNYMESKELHHDKSKQKEELENYMNELTQDIYEMISDADPEQKMLLSQKLSTLAEKVR